MQDWRKHGTDPCSRRGLLTLSWAGDGTPSSPSRPEPSGPISQGDSEGCPASRHPSQTDESKASGGRCPAKGRAATPTSTFQGPACVAWPSPHTPARSAKWGPSWKGLEAESSQGPTGSVTEGPNTGRGPCAPPEGGPHPPTHSRRGDPAGEVTVPSR